MVELETSKFAEASLSVVSLTVKHADPTGEESGVGANVDSGVDPGATGRRVRDVGAAVRCRVCCWARTTAASSKIATDRIMHKRNITPLPWTVRARGYIKENEEKDKNWNFQQYDSIPPCA